MNAKFPNSPGTTPLVAMALIDMAVSSVCKRRGKQLLHTTGNVLQSATGFIINESLSQRLSDTPTESQAFCCHSLFYSTTVMQVYKILNESQWGSMNESFVSLDLKYQLFHVGKAIRSTARPKQTQSTGLLWWWIWKIWKYGEKKKYK